MTAYPRESECLYWPTPACLARSLPREDCNVVCYELAPTGRVHAGIVRTLLYAEKLRRELAAMGKTGRMVLRVNDRAAEKGTGDKTVGDGAALAAFLPARGVPARSALEQLLEELEVCSKRFGTAIDHVEFVSTVYTNPRFRTLLSRCLTRANDIRQQLARHQASDVVLFRPLCARCRRMYCAVVTGEASSGRGVYVCRKCGYSELFDAGLSEGLLAFKLESAVMWEYFHAEVDLHGQDHIEAYEASAALATTLGLRRPLAGRVNLTFNSQSQKVSKSDNNFVPVVDLDQRQTAELRRLILATPWSRPLRLPFGY